VIVHAGAAEVADAIELARHAERIGATAISSLPPQGATVEQILAPPHEGILLYERWKRMAFCDFKRETLPFENNFINQDKGR